MKTIYLLRHAKSSWDHPDIDDYQRPLAPRGIEAATRLGRFMASEELVPERVLCSGARRAQESWSLVSRGLGVPVPVKVLPEIYHGSLGMLMGFIHGLPDSEGSVLLVGHNPTFHHLALLLAGSGKEGALQRLQFKYPTGALAVLDFSVQAWSEVTEGDGHLRDFIRPKDLK